MRQRELLRWSSTAAVAILIALLVGPAGGTAQTLGGITQTLTGVTQTLTGTLSSPTVAGNASAVRSTILGMTSVLAGTGALAGAGDARDASLVTGSLPSLFSGEALHAVTMSWPDQVVSQASLADLGLSLPGASITADFLMASATAVQGAAADGSSLISNLSINGTPVWVTGAPNQRVWIPGGLVVLNEQTISPAGTTVNALHAMVYGLADVTIASATAAIQ